MILVFLLHALALYLNQKTIFYIWDYFHFAVASFIFCSAYVFFKKGISAKEDLQLGVSYFVKRIQRLYMPFFYFFAVLVVCMAVFEPSKLSSTYILNSLLIIGGVDISWLVLLFVQFTVLFPLLLHWYRHNTQLFYFYAVVAVVSSVSLFFYTPELSWKWYMWLPWSVMALFAIFFTQNEEKYFSRINMVYLGAGIVFVALQILEFIQDGRITIYTHKYPPDLTKISYGILMIGLMHKAYTAGILDKLRVVPFLSFLSTYSYPLFFVHYIVIYLMNRAGLHKELSAFVYFIILVTLTVLVQKLIVIGSSRISTLRGKN